MSKRYKILKESINYTTGIVIPEGTIFNSVPDKTWFQSDNGWQMSKLAVEKEDWFELLPKEAEITDIHGGRFMENGKEVNEITVRVNRRIFQQDLPAIKKSIEIILNGDAAIEPSVAYVNLDAQHSPIRKTYTEKDLEDAFNAGKSLWAKEFEAPKIQQKFQTFASYKETLKK